MRSSLLQISVLLLAAAQLVSVNSFAQDSGLYVICKNGKEVRTLRAEKNPANGKCKALYTKAGKAQSVAEGQNPDTCDQVVARIQGTLEAADWKCREVKDSTVSEVVDQVQ